MLLLFFVLPLSTVAFAQPNVAAWNEDIEKQVVESLGSSIERIQDNALHIVIYYKGHDRFHGDERFDFEEASGRLVELV